MKTEIRTMLDHAHGTRLQNSYGLATRPRAKKLSVQLQAALDDAAKATKADVSTQKLIQARIVALQKLIDRKQHEKTKKLTDANTRLKSEVEKLKLDLAVALEVRPVTARPPSAVEIALQNYDKEKNGGANGN